MTRRWLAYTARGCEGEIRRAIATTGEYESISFMRSAVSLREALRDEEPRSCCVAVGLSDEGVSDVNVAAALVADGLADEVMLVVHGVTGSLRSRSSAAGIARVVDADILDLDEPIFDRVAMRGQAANVVHARGPRGSDVGSSENEASDSRAETVTEKRVPAERGSAATMRRIPPLETNASAPVLTFLSGRGGVGKTSLVAMTASVAADWGLRVALLDLDLCCGNLSSPFGCGKQGDLSVLVAGETLDMDGVAPNAVMCRTNIFLWGPVERPEMAEIVTPIVGTLITHLAGTFDLVLIDTSTTCTDAVAQAIQSADRVIMVHDDRPGAIRALSRMSALAIRLGVARTQVVRVDNRCPPRLWGQPFLPRAEPGLETARAYRVLDGGDEVSELCAEGKLSELMEFGGDYTRSVATFAAGQLQELGRLPDCDGAQEAASGVGLRKRSLLFGRRKEAV